MLIFSSFERGTLLISTNCVSIGILHIHYQIWHQKLSKTSQWCLDCPTRKKKKNSNDPWGVIDGSWNNERLTFCVCTCVFKFLYIAEGTSYIIYYTHSEITGGPCNLISSNWCDLFTNRTIFCFKSHLFPSQSAGHTKNKKNQSDLKACLK